MSKLPLLITITLFFWTWPRVRSAPLQEVGHDEDLQVRSEEEQEDVDGDTDDEDYDSEKEVGGSESSEEDGDEGEGEDNGNDGDLDNSEVSDDVEERGNYFEGDMILVESYNGLKDKKYRWPDATVPYTISRSFVAKEREVMRNGMKLISSRTCIKFVKRRQQKDYVAVTRGNKNTGCNAIVGHIGGKQNLNFEASCLSRDDGAGVVAHEFMHSLGFYHEQSRSDRDDYISVDLTNVENGRESYFQKHPEGEVDPFGEQYDYGSIMHYRANAFAKDPEKPTIISKRKGMNFGQRKELSNADVRKLQRMYCPDIKSNDYEEIDSEDGDEDLTD